MSKKYSKILLKWLNYNNQANPYNISFSFLKISHKTSLDKNVKSKRFFYLSIQILVDIKKVNSQKKLNG